MCAELKGHQRLFVQEADGDLEHDLGGVGVSADRRPILGPAVLVVAVTVSVDAQGDAFCVHAQRMGHGAADETAVGEPGIGRLRGQWVRDDGWLTDAIAALAEGTDEAAVHALGMVAGQAG